MGEGAGVARGEASTWLYRPTNTDVAVDCLRACRTVHRHSYYTVLYVLLVHRIIYLSLHQYLTIGYTTRVSNKINNEQDRSID